MTTPIFYSFRRCPYAMRARLALQVATQTVELREVVLKNKPAELLQVSPKATVPVLVLSDGTVIDESLDIMLWALCENTCEDKPENKSQYKPHYGTYNWLGEKSDFLNKTVALIDQNDNEFKTNLDAYKYADRYPEPAEYYRQQSEFFLCLLEERLTQQAYLMGNQISLADIAIFPFIRQFATVDIDWFNQSPYIKLQQWLSEFLAADWFVNVMSKYPAWQTGDAALMFPEKDFDC